VNRRGFFVTLLAAPAAAFVSLKAKPSYAEAWRIGDGGWSPRRSARVCTWPPSVRVPPVDLWFPCAENGNRFVAAYPDGKLVASHDGANWTAGTGRDTNAYLRACR